MTHTLATIFVILLTNIEKSLTKVNNFMFVLVSIEEMVFRSSSLTEPVTPTVAMVILSSFIPWATSTPNGRLLSSPSVSSTMTR